MLFVGIGAVCSHKQEGRDPFGSPTVPQQSPALSGGAHLPAVTVITAGVGGAAMEDLSKCRSLVQLTARKGVLARQGIVVIRVSVSSVSHLVSLLPGIPLAPPKT